MEQLLAFAAETRSSIGHHTATLSQPNLLAQICLLVEAEFASLALRSVQWNDMIANFEVGHSRTDRFNNAGTFVTFECQIGDYVISA